MRLAHLADLHLGKVFHGFSLIEDQRHALAEVVRALRDAEVDALLLAGDLYDRALPGREAVRLLDDFLREVAQGLGVPVIAIAGNHDSGDHLGFGAWLFATGDVHLRGRVERDAHPVTLEDPHGPVTFYPIPYFEPESARDLLGIDPGGAEGSELTHRDIVGVMLRRARAHVESNAVTRAVVVAHAFVQGRSPPEESRRSERTLYLGGQGAIPFADFEGFRYVALGHLHRPQDVGEGGRGRYPGSLLKYSFDEAGQTRGFTLAELSGDGALRVEHVVVAPRRDLAVLRGSLDELLEDPAHGSVEGHFVCAEITDRPPPPQAMERLRRRFPYAAELRFARDPGQVTPAVMDLRAVARDPEAAFAEFYARHAGAPPSEAERAVFREALGVAGGGDPTP